MALSIRAQAAQDPSRKSLMWEIIPNLWDPATNPQGFVSLGVAENTMMHDALAKHIQENIALKNSAFTYGDGTLGSKRLKNAVSRFMTRHLRPVVPIDPSHVSITNGCSAALEHLSWALANPGEGFLLGQPYYGTFLPDLTLRFGAKVLPVPFHDIDPFAEDAVKKYEDILLDAQARGQTVSGLVISHPHNPLGRCYPRSVLIKLMQLCEGHKIHFISDEIYALSVWSNTIDKHPPPIPFESALSIDPTGIIDPARIHVLWGMSKDFGANGIRVGAIISQANPSLHAALVPVGLYSSASSISDHITANVLEDDSWVEAYMAENQRMLSGRYELVVKWAKQYEIAYAPGVNAAFFLWVNLGEAYGKKHVLAESEDVTDITMQKLLAHKVFLASGTAFGAEKPGWFRIVFSHDEDYLNEGLRRIIAALSLHD